MKILITVNQPTEIRSESGTIRGYGPPRVGYRIDARNAGDLERQALELHALSEDPAAFITHRPLTRGRGNRAFNHYSAVPSIFPDEPGKRTERALWLQARASC